MAIDRKEFEKAERGGVTRKDFEDALKQVLGAPRGELRSENREPTTAELNERWKMVRRRKQRLALRILLHNSHKFTPWPSSV